VTSPPYFGLRSYLDPDDPDKAREMGAEATPAEFVTALVEVFREVRRVLRDDGTVWLNLGDSYASSPPGNKTTGVSAKSGLNGVNGASGKYRETLDAGHATKRDTSRLPGLKPKDLIGIPWRVAFALQDDGWYLRQDIVWHKPNPMPESVQDRCTKSHEYIFLLTKSARYYWDAEAAKEPGVYPAGTKAAKGSAERAAQEGVNARPPEYKVYDGKRNRRSVWTVTTKPFKGAHFATFPKDLIEPCIAIGAPEKCCAACGAGRVRIVEKETVFAGGSGAAGRSAEDANASGKWAGQQYGKNIKLGPVNLTQTVGWKPGCDCNAPDAMSTVLDPFGGAGTTALAARELKRKSILIELDRKSVRLSEERLGLTDEDLV
jgi:site-specific DNA-methyltransferase (adenine-specific)